MLIPWTGVQVRNGVLVRSVACIVMCRTRCTIRFASQIGIGMGFRRCCIPRSSQVLAPWMSAIQRVARRERCRLDGAARRLCGNRTVWTEIACLRDGRDCGLAVIHRRAQILVRACELLMVLLFLSGRDVLFFRSLKFLRCGLRLYTAITSVIANVGCVVIDNLLVVDIVDDCSVTDICN